MCWIVSSMEVEENIWESAESARQIEKLVQVEQEIVRLMELASQGMSLLALPQTDSSEEARTLPRGPNRSDAFANTAESYFKTLNVWVFLLCFLASTANAFHPLTPTPMPRLLRSVRSDVISVCLLDNGGKNKPEPNCIRRVGTCVGQLIGPLQLDQLATNHRGDWDDFVRRTICGEYSFS